MDSYFIFLWNNINAYIITYFDSELYAALFKKIDFMA